MHLWRKLASADWLQRHDAELQAVSGRGVAVVTVPGRKRIEIECCCRLRQAQHLQRRFGGTIKRLARNWQKELIAPARRPPIRVGKRLLIMADELDARAAAKHNSTRRVLLIPAGLAFGTGEHVTTAMCLRVLETIARKLPSDWTMLDAGTGTGILALAASCFGARYVHGIDNDPRAIAVAKENAAVNHIAGIGFSRADVLTRSDDRLYDIVTANLFSDLLIAALPNLKKHLRHGGFLIASGVLCTQEAELVRALRASDFSAPEIRRRGKWSALIANRR